PFNEEQVQRVAKAEPTLRDMLQQFRQMFDRLVYEAAPPMLTEAPLSARVSMPELPAAVKSVIVLESTADTWTAPQPQSNRKPDERSTETLRAQYGIASDAEQVKPLDNGQRP